MGFGDIAWPFDRDFAKIPGAREGGLAGCMGGPVFGTLTYILKGSRPQAFKATFYGGLVCFWATFAFVRLKYTALKNRQGEFVRAYKAGKID